MRLAHMSDLHLFKPGIFDLKELLWRRIPGALNLLLTRRDRHSIRAAVTAIAAIEETQVDHCIITGDLTNLSLDAEFQLVLEVLKPINSYERLTVVPGNHDFYTPDATNKFEKFFGHLLWREGNGCYPACKDINNVRIIVLKTAICPPPLFSFGKVGTEQLERCVALVSDAKTRGQFVVVGLHHNLHRRGLLNETIGRLLDRDLVLSKLAEARVDLVLSGHDHRPKEFVVPRPDGKMMHIFGCGSTSLDNESRGMRGRFNIYEIDSDVRVSRWELEKASFCPRQ